MDGQGRLRFVLLTQDIVKTLPEAKSSKLEHKQFLQGMEELNMINAKYKNIINIKNPNSTFHHRQLGYS